ncbi:DUF3017 domain-containing protein [Propioniciclava coleopterorum]|uniref:DUF3017 domain-containing protein n=1 Tax=Propioniciclava coleopterorum TaxID=2714937 RepID=A0A6G7Y8K8_9ACTN|nr:DUF3017 domain-containing protein [Propioniciclava coleopterorum]QIK73049.1 DUF3017 domain-containing protein [Propioniciclava coleopterorum]
MTEQPRTHWAPEQGPRPPRPWHAQVVGQWPLAVVLLGIAAGVVWAGTGHWKRGSFLIGATFALATVLRAALPADRVGLLAVRSRAVDVCCLAVLAVGIVTLSLIVPPQP